VHWKYFLFNIYFGLGPKTWVFFRVSVPLTIKKSYLRKVYFGDKCINQKRVWYSVTANVFTYTAVNRWISSAKVLSLAGERYGRMVALSIDYVWHISPISPISDLNEFARFMHSQDFFICSSIMHILHQSHQSQRQCPQSEVIDQRCCTACFGHPEYGRWSVIII
jgi:hypothetical protein